MYVYAYMYLLYYMFTHVHLHIICRPSKLFTKFGKVKFHPKSVNSDETTFDNKFMIYYTMVKSSAVFIHDCSMIPPYPLLFFGGDISVQEDEGQELIVVDQWIKFQAPRKIAELVKVCVHDCMCQWVSVQIV